MTDTVDVNNMAPSTVQKTSSGSEAFKSFVSGGFGGICLVLVGHPFDLVKVRIQTGASYGSTFGAFRSILAEDGLRGLYRGMSTPLVGIAPIFAICFWGYDVGQRLVRSLLDMRSGKDQYKYSEQELSLAAISAAGGFSALPTTLVMTPTERIKVMLQTQTLQKGQPQFSGPIHVVRSIIGSDGLRGAMKLYQGTLATLCRDVPGSVAYFAVYEGVKRGLTHCFYSGGHQEGSGRAKPTLPVFAILLAGGLAGMANWIVAIPADVIKSRIQANTGPTSLSGLAILSQLWQKEGPRALFKGLGPALIRAFPANAACFMGVEIARKVLHSY